MKLGVDMACRSIINGNILTGHRVTNALSGPAWEYFQREYPCCIGSTLLGSLPDKEGHGGQSDQRRLP